MSRNRKLPLVYSCSGASSAAQMANHLAVRLDRLQIAEMSCIAGVGGDVKPLVHTARSGRPILALDGCPLHCAAKILERHGLAADRHYDLSELGVRKKQHEDFDPEEAAQVLRRIQEEVARDFGTDGGTGTEEFATAPSHALSEADEDELREPFSPVCYRKDFEDW